MPFTLDRADKFQARVYDQLQHEIIVWLTTVTSSGQPQPNPVWYMWDGADRLIVYSKPDSARMRNIASNPKVSLNFDTDARGDMAAILTGTIAVDGSVPPCNQLPGYAEKYHAGLVQLDTDIDNMAGEFTVPLVVTIDKLRGY
jgi:PPOX class probable F420-dependent enzyme